MSLELAARAGDEALRERASKTLWTANAGLIESPFSYATHIGLLRQYPPPEY